MSGESPDAIKMRQYIDETEKALKPNKSSDESSDELIKVKHMKDTAKYRPANDRSWKEYWERKSIQNFPTADEICACCKKLTKPEDFVGAHIEEVENPKKQYIYPLCKYCNSKYGEGKDDSPIFEVKKSHCVPFSLDEAVEIVEHLDE